MSPGDLPTSRTHSGRYLASLLLAALLPGHAWSEGAVKRLDCEVTLVCNAAGECEAPAAARVRFEMEPVELDAGGAGSYSMSYAGTRVEMQAESETGPFLWSLDRERHALMPSSETGWLWHALTLDPVPGAAIRFMRCEFQQ